MDASGRFERKVHIGENSDEFARIATRLFLSSARKCLKRCEKFTVILSGGETPRETYRLLSQQKGVDWGRVHFFMADERFVPPGDPDSNYRMVLESLLAAGTIPADHVYRIRTEIGTAAQAAEDYEAAIRVFFGLKDQNHLPAFDFAFLGIGNDGHTASIFPGMEVEARNGEIVIAPFLPGNGVYRISIAENVLCRTGKIIFLAKGRGKARIVARVLLQEKSLPAARVLALAPDALLVVDRDAAAAIKNASLKL